MAKQTPPPQKLIRFDWFIKKMLRDKADFEILEGFLSELLKEDVVIEDIIESESNKDDREDKFNRVDVLVKTADDERIIVEIQNTRELDYLQRIYYGTSKTLVENLSEGAKYKDIKRIISISVVYFKLGIGRDYVYIGETNFRGNHDPTDILGLSVEQLAFFANPKINIVSDIFARYFIIRAGEFNEKVEDALDEWIYFFKTATVRGNVPAKGLDKAKERLRVSQLTGKDLANYNHFLELQHSDASYEAQFKFELEKGIKEKTEKLEEEMRIKEEEVRIKEEEMIVEMQKEGLSIKQMAKIAKKTEQEITEIITQHRK